MIATSASDGRRGHICLGEIRHAVFGDEVVTVDWVTIIVSIQRDARELEVEIVLYPPHMRLLPVKADLPCSTRQLSKTVTGDRSVAARQYGF